MSGSFTFAVLVIFMLTAADLAHAQPTPTATAVGPWRTGVAVTCPGGRVIPANTVISGPDVTPAQLCGTGSSSSSSSGASGAVVSNTGNFAQDTVTNSVNLAIVMNTKNPMVSSFMQGAATSFISSMFANNAEAQRQQQAMAAAILQRQQEQERQARIAQQQKFDAMYARLSQALKLEGVPFGLSLKPMSTGQDLQLKNLSSSGPGDLKLKMGNSGGYGIQGLPGIYVGGPAGGSSGGPAGEGSTNGGGMPGLPGIYLSGVQPSQAPALAQTAQTLNGPERTVAEDTALQTAQQNPALTAPSQDPRVANFQQANQDYQEALQENTKATVDYQTAQAHVAADQSALDVAQKQLQSVAPSAEQQQAFNQMLAAAKSDEAASAVARQGFDSTEIHLSASRDRAVVALAATSPTSSTAPVAGLRPEAVAMNLKAPDRTGTPVSLPMPKASLTKPSLPVASVPAGPLHIEAQLHARLEGLQEALRRLSEDEKKRGEAREAAAKDVDEAVEDAEERGVGMLFDLLATGWDNCAPLAQGGVVGKFERDAARIEGQIQDVYKEASAAKAGSDLGPFNEKAEALDRTKLWLERSIHQIEASKHVLDTANAAGETNGILKESKGDWQSSLEGLGKTIGMALDDKRITDYLGSDKIGMVTCHVAAIKATSSAIDSALDIFKEGNAAEDLRRMDDNTMKFLGAQKELDRKLKATTAQLNCYKLPDPASLVSCAQKTGQP